MYSGHVWQLTCTDRAGGGCYTAAMRRSLQEVVELVVFGLVALLIGTGLLWLVGWVFSLGGLLLKAIAGLLWLLLRFVVPVAIVAGLVYFIVKALQNRESGKASAAPAGTVQAATSPSAAPATSPASAAPTPTTFPASAAPATPAADGAEEAEAAATVVTDPEAPESESDSAQGDEPAEDDA